MAGKATIGALRVTLGADTAQFHEAMGRAQKSMRRVGAVMVKAGAAIAAAAAAAGAAMAAAVMRFSSEADKLAKMSRSIGIPIEDLSRLKHAADLSGVGLDALGNAVKRLSANMGEVASGATSTASRAFAALGVQVKAADGSLRSSTHVMTDIAERFARMEDGAGKTALAIALFGRAGADLIPLLNEGAGGMNRLMAEADALGITLDANTGAAAERFNDNMSRLKSLWHGIVNQVSAQLLPVLADLAGKLIELVQKSGTMKVAVWLLANALRGLVTAGVLVAAAFKALGEVVSAVAQSVYLAAQGEFQRAFEALKGGFSEVGDTARSSLEMIKSIWGQTSRELAAESATLGNRMAAPVMEAANKAKASLTETQKSVNALGQSVQSSMEGAFDSIVQGTFDARQAVAGLLNDLAKVAFRQATMGLIGGAGSGGLLGLMGFASGGSFTVGGSGGTDSQLVAFKATPGEMVDVRTPGQQSGASGGQTTVVFNGDMAPANRAWVMGLVDRLRGEVPQLAQGAVRQQIANDPGFRRP